MPIIVLIIRFLRSLQKMSDEELVGLYKSSGNLEYVGELFKRKTHLIAGICFKYLKNELETEDGTYEVFEIISKDLLNHDVQHINAWLFTVTRNHCYKKLRKTISEREIIEKENNSSDYYMESSKEVSLDEKEQLDFQLDLMGEVIGQLKEEQQICVKLFYLEKKSYIEIEQITGFEIKKVKSYIQNGKRNLRILMEKEMKKEQ